MAEYDFQGREMEASRSHAWSSGEQPAVVLV